VIAVFRHYCLYSAFDTCVDDAAYLALREATGLCATLGPSVIAEIFAASDNDLFSPGDDDPEEALLRGARADDED
jgi:hypothetical protein